MLALDVTIAISEHSYQNAKAFLDFLRRAARKHSVTFSVSEQFPVVSADAQEMLRFKWPRDIKASVPGKDRENFGHKTVDAHVR
jgi:hypothetical protein